MKARRTKEMAIFPWLPVTIGVAAGVGIGVVLGRTLFVRRAPSGFLPAGQAKQSEQRSVQAVDRETPWLHPINPFALVERIASTRRGGYSPPANGTE